MTAELSPGRQLSENELAVLLGVSRTPVRGALARLREDRLVVIVPQLGTFVTLISRSGVEDAAFVREALECAAVRLTTERIDEMGLEAIQANLAAQERAESDHDVEGFDQLDEDLHRTICQYSGHEIAWALGRRANGHLDRVRRLSLPEVTYMSEMLEDHKNLVAAIANGTPAVAESRLRQHLRKVLSNIEQIRQNHPDYFEEE